MKPFLRLSGILICMGDMDDNGYRNASANSNKIESFFATNAPCYFFVARYLKSNHRNSFPFYDLQQKGEIR